MKQLPSLDSFKSEVSGVIAVYENFVVAAAIITKYFGLPRQLGTNRRGLPGLSVESAQACTDKALMRQKFLDYNPSISPNYQEVAAWQDIENFMASHDWPLILKPANLVKSLLVTRNDNQTELKENFEHASAAIHKLYAKHGVKRQPKLIIEEYLEGSVHSVDGFADKAGKMHLLDQVVDYETGYDVGKNENYHFSRLLPSRLATDELTAIHRVAEQGMKALGMTSSPAHVEIILTKDGPKIVEIGTRTGGYRPRMHQFANKIDLYKAMVDTATGKIPDIKAQANDSCAVLEIFPDREGKFVSLAWESKVRQLPSLLYLSIKPKAGMETGRASKGFKAAAVIMLGNNDAQQLKRDYSYIKDQVVVEVG